MSTTYHISKLSDSSPTDTDAAVTVIDASIGQVEDALNNLSARVDNLTTKSAVIRQHVPLAAGVLVGDLVYYDAHNDIDEELRRGEYAKALATTLAETTRNGQTIEAPSARVEGIVVAVDSGTSPLTGTLLIGGYWISDTAMQNCLGDDYEHPGIYYLSPINAGKATLDPGGHLRQPVLSYYGAGQFSMSLFYMAHDNHFHSSQVLSSGYWTGVSDVVIEGRPAYYKYTGPTAAALGDIGDTTAVFYNGVLQNTNGNTGLFAIQDGYLYYMDGTAGAPTGTVILFNHYPFAYESAVVRTVYSTNDAITVKNTNGNIAITGNDFIQGVTAKSSQAIYSINGNELNYTPVVTDLVAGPGMVVSRALDGTAVVSTSTVVGSLMDAYSVNHNGTTLISDASNPPLQYITFPAGRYAEYVMYLPVHDIGEAVCTAAVWGMKLGTAAATLDITARFIPDPVSGGSTSISELPSGSASLNIAGGTATSSLSYGEVDVAGVTVSGSGMLVAVVGCTASQQIQLLRTGFKLHIDAEQTTSTRGIALEDSTAITQTMTVATGENIFAGDALMISNGYLVRCLNQKNGLADNTNKCVGVATARATEGQSLTYMITGTMTLPVDNAEPGDSLYIDENGKLTPVDDVDAFMANVRFLQKVGTVLTGNKIQVNIESAVRSSSNG